jgi:hypothetical protein
MSKKEAKAHFMMAQIEKEVGAKFMQFLLIIIISNCFKLQTKNLKSL